jgi:sugar phosphate permease
MLGDYFPKAQRGRVMAFWSIGNLIGTALGLVLGGLIADAFGWRWAFYVVGIPGLVTALLIWRATEPTRGAFENGEDADSSTTHEHGSLGKHFWQTASRLFQIPTYWVVLGAFIFSFFTVGSASVWIPSYFVETFKLSVSQAGAISGGVLAGGSIVGTLLGGWLADFLQRRRPQGRLLVATSAFLLGAPFTLLALSIHTLIPCVIIFTIAIICLSLCLGPLNAVIQDIVAPGMRATAIGLALLLAHLLGDAASPLIIGSLADRLSSLGLALVLTTPPCLLIAGLFCLIGLRTVALDMNAMRKQVSRQHAA